MKRTYVQKSKQKDVIKSIDTDERLFTAVVLRPDVVDSHGDIYDADVVKNACHDFNSTIMSNGGTNIQHSVDIDKSVMQFVESFIAPIDMEYEFGTVLKGDWVATAKIYDDDIWKMCKDGTFTGFSVGCSALTEDLE